MNYVRFGKWVCIAALILTLILTTYRLAIPVPEAGTYMDPGELGYLRLIEVLRKEGHPVYLGFAPPKTNCFVLILDPVNCHNESLEHIVAAYMKCRKAVIAFDLGSYQCAEHILDAIEHIYMRVDKVYASAMLAFRGLNVTIPTVTIISFHLYGGAAYNATPIAYAYGQPVGYVAGSIGRVAVIGDVDCLRNWVLSNETRHIKALLNSIGVGENDVAVVPIEVQVRVIPLTINLYNIALALLDKLSTLEKSLLSSPYSIAYMFVMLLVPLAIALRVAWPRGGRAEDTIYSKKPKPSIFGATSLYIRFTKGKGLSKSEAKEVVARLYDILDTVLRLRFGLGVEKALKEPRVVEALSNLSGEPKESIMRTLTRLYRLRRKIEGKAILPFVLSWPRAAQELVSSVRPILRVLGVELEKLKGLEVVLSREH